MCLGSHNTGGASLTSAGPLAAPSMVKDLPDIHTSVWSTRAYGIIYFIAAPGLAPHCSCLQAAQVSLSRLLRPGIEQLRVGAAFASSVIA